MCCMRVARMPCMPRAVCRVSLSPASVSHTGEGDRWRDGRAGPWRWAGDRRRAARTTPGLRQARARGFGGLRIGASRVWSRSQQEKKVELRPSPACRENQETNTRTDIHRPYTDTQACRQARKDVTHKPGRAHRHTDTQAHAHTGEGEDAAAGALEEHRGAADHHVAPGLRGQQRQVDHHHRGCAGEGGGPLWLVGIDSLLLFGKKGVLVALWVLKITRGLH